MAVLCLQASYFIAGRLTGWIGRHVFQGTVTTTEKISPAIGTLRRVQFSDVQESPGQWWKTAVLTAVFHGSALTLIFGTIFLVFPILLGLLLPVFFPQLSQ
jgi:hypothetical protein